MTAAAGESATADAYDVVVLGAGPVGENVAERARSAGLGVAIVEHELVGGECSYWACIPSKALLRPVLAVSDARRVDGAQQEISGPPDASGAFERRDGFVSGWKDQGQAEWLRGVGVDLIRGHGRLDGARRVVVDTADRGRQVLTARHAVAVCTGSSAVIPDLPGIREVRPWTNREATDSEAVPRRLAVVGGGGVGVEMATAWQGLGASVTMLVRGKGLLPRMEPFVGDLVARRLADTGVDVRLGVSVTELRRPDGTGPLTVLLDDSDQLDVDEVLFATGRAPRTGDIGLETVGFAPGTWLDVDDTCRVRGLDDGWLYAVGDVNHRALLTHQGKYQARIAGAVIGARAAGRPLDTAPWGTHAATADSHAVPQVFFTDPEAAAVGLSAAEAERAGHRVRVVDVDLGKEVVGALLYADGYRGRARIVVDVDHGYLVGATFVGPGVGELLHSATVAVAGRVPIDRLWHAVPCFPTISEVWLRLLEGYRS